MDIRDLRYVIALNDCGTLTKAAKRLHVSRQAVAKTVRNLEAEAGARLFERIDALLRRRLLCRYVCPQLLKLGNFIIGHVAISRAHNGHFCLHCFIPRFANQRTILTHFSRMMLDSLLDTHGNLLIFSYSHVLSLPQKR